MSDQIDSAIKLFGRTISFTTKASDHDHHSPPTHVSLDHNPSLSHEGTLVNVSGKQDKVKEISQNDGSNSKDPTTTSSGVSENSKTSSGDNKETSSHKSFKRGEQSETSSSQEKPLKKPDKILPCPRCSSMDTKFCYYNNYNVNQPRHFCKNCQRYWTAGGSMRNVPVGAGRRKSKTTSTTSNNHHQDMAVSEALLAAQASSANGFVYGGRILTFGSGQSPPCESAQQKTQPLLTPEQKKAINNPTSDHHKESHHSCSSFPQACFPAAAAPWPFHPWNSAAVPLPSPPHAFCPPSFPVSFYPPPAYWGYNLVPPPCHPLISLGKHSRDENSSWIESKAQYSERQVLVPKTLRIDDPGEAARSSIWATLGIKGDNKPTSITTGGLFNGFQSKSNERSPPSLALQANPAALSRSVKFHEST